MDGRNPGESGNNAATLLFLVHNMLHAMSKLESSVFFPTLPGPPHSLLVSKSPDSNLPRPRPRGDRGWTGTAKLATVIKLMSCIGQGTARQWQPELGRQPGPGPGPRRRTQQARRRLAGPAAPATGPSRAQPVALTSHGYMVRLISVILCNIGNIM